MTQLQLPRARRKLPSFAVSCGILCLCLRFLHRQTSLHRMLPKYKNHSLQRRFSIAQVRLTRPDGIGSTNTVCCAEGSVSCGSFQRSLSVPQHRRCCTGRLDSIGLLVSYFICARCKVSSNTDVLNTPYFPANE